MFVNTEEQLSIIKCKSNFLAIKAFAGTGKTTTLKAFAEANLDKRILYVAYNKETAKQARFSFPSNVTSKTAHSIAYSKFGHRLSKKLDRKTSLPFKPETVRKLFGLKRNQKSIKLSKDLKSIIDAFCFSNYSKIEDAIPFQNLSESREVITMFCNELWDEMTDPESNFPSTPDIYLKQYHLSNPVLDYDYILFDEAQDANPLILDLILAQQKNGVKLVFVGDEHQSIYSFRGAKNSLSQIKPDVEMYLTKSFRFGTSIAYVANAILKTLKGEEASLSGFDEIKDRISEVNKTKQFAVITRTNANLFLSAIKAYEQGYKIHFVGGFENYNFKKILDIEKLYLDNKSGIRDSYIRTFDNFADYQSVANYTNDKEMLYYVKVVEKYNGQLSDLIYGLKKNSTDLSKANIVLSTAHKAKGLEFEQVALSNDFPSFVGKDKSIDFRSLKVDEINILYVAATRAIKVLKPNKQLDDIIEYYKLNIENNKGDIINQRDKKTIFISNIKNKF